MQPKSIVAGGSMTGVGGSQTASIVAVTENPDDVQYFPRTTKKLTIQGANNSPPSNMNDTVNVVFRAPVVSSSSNQSMRPPPPPPPKIKGHSEEPSSSIPDLGKFALFIFSRNFPIHFFFFRIPVPIFIFGNPQIFLDSLINIKITSKKKPFASHPLHDDERYTKRTMRKKLFEMSVVFCLFECCWMRSCVCVLPIVHFFLYHLIGHSIQMTENSIYYTE